MGWVLSGAGLVVSGYAASQAAKQERILAEDEADQAENQAEGEVAAGSFQSDRIRKRAEEIMSSNTAAAAKGGGSSTDASVMAVQAETVENATLDQLMTMAAAQERARMMRRDARQMRATGKVREYSGKMNAWSNYVGAAATAIEGVSSMMGGFSGGSSVPSRGMGNSHISYGR